MLLGKKQPFLDGRLQSRKGRGTFLRYLENEIYNYAIIKQNTESF